MMKKLLWLLLVPAIAIGINYSPQQSLNILAASNLLNICSGADPSVTCVIIRGHNPDIDSATYEDMWEQGGLKSHLAEGGAETMNIVSTDVDDDGDPADTGCRTLKITCVDDSGDLTSETVTLNGTTNVTTTILCQDVNQMQCLTAGSSGWNEGSITATASSAGSVQSRMDATESLSQDGFYRVPDGYTFYLYQVELNAAKIVGGGNPEMEFKGRAKLFSTGTTAPWLQLFDKRIDTAVTDELDIKLPFPTKMPEKTVIKIQANSDTANSEARIRMYGILRQN